MVVTLQKKEKGPVPVRFCMIGHRTEDRLALRQCQCILPNCLVAGSKGDPRVVQGGDEGEGLSVALDRLIEAGHRQQSVAAVVPARYRAGFTRYKSVV